MLIDKTKLNAKKKVYVPGPHIIRYNRLNGEPAGEVLILVDMSIRYYEIKIKTKSIRIFRKLNLTQAILS